MAPNSKRKLILRIVYNQLKKTDPSLVFRMPFSYTINEEHDLWLMVGLGHATSKQYVDCVLRAIEEPNYHWDIDLILDFSKIGELEMELQDLAKIKALEDAAIKAFGFQPYKVAIISRNVSELHLVELYQAMMKEKGLEVKDFKSLTHALEWLNKADAYEAIETVRTQLHQEMSEL